MSARRMHADEVDTDVALVRRLLAGQFPQWADLSIEPIASAGTDHAIYRLGDDMSVRLPRIHWAVGQGDKEREWLPRLAPQLPLALPVPRAKGAPAEGFPWDWSVYEWIEGDYATAERVDDLEQAARDVAEFVLALQQIDTAGGPHADPRRSRGAPLRARDASTRPPIEALRDMYDADALTAIWETALRAPEWDRSPVWFHGDLLAGNLLVERGRIRAVIDFGGLGVGDPACDLMIAWGLFSGSSRDVFRSALAVDDATWARARGHALSQAVQFVPYYLGTNPVGVARAQRTIEAILADPDS